MRLALPYWPGLIVFAVALGGMSEQLGLTLPQTLALMAFLHAGSAQIISYQLWQEVWTVASLLAVIGVSASVNLRLVLMGASMRGWIDHVPGRIVYPLALYLTDMTWALSIAYRARGGRDLGVFLGSAISTWIAWIVMAIPGYVMVSLIHDPRVFGLDLMTVILFSTMATPVLRRSPVRMPFVVAGLVSVVTWLALGGFWFMVVGALAGAFAAAFAGGDAR